ncbi:MAG: fumarylacetoacetate hydrolase family protein [Spirochaetia bacterium]|nr:fumarylacetoacetate hydrolase family protein [Spirochaetia bacterium]
MKYICIGKNYLAHAEEFGGSLPEEPMFFFKPENAAPSKDGIFPYPDFSDEVDYEVELAVRIDTSCRRVSAEDAGNYYSQVSVGMDFTARDLQRRQGKLGFPWEVCKSFEDSSPVGKWVSLDKLGKGPQELEISLEQNGKQVQLGKTQDMIFSVNQLISHVSRFITLDAGDILLSGTPEGVGPVKPGDKLQAYLEGEELLQVKVV